MEERIKQIRKYFGLTQTEFAGRLGLSRNHIAQVETGKGTFSDRTINDICREFNISEDWLRYGNGEMLKSGDNQLANYFASIANGNDEFIREFVMVYMELDDLSKKTIQKLVMDIADKINGRD